MIDFGGAAVGAVFGELLNVIMVVKNNIRTFKPSLERMKNILQCIIPIVKEIEELNKALEHRKEETEKIMEVIMEGKELVLECDGIYRYNFWKQEKYKEKLDSLEESLKLFCQIVMQAQALRAINEVLLEVRAKPSSSNSKVGGLDALCLVPEPPMNPVGFQMALAELKMELFEGGVSMVVLSGPPGCGKTTLAKLLCHDRKVKEKFQDNIFYVTVSKNAGIDSVAHRLFKHKSYNVGEFWSDVDVIYHLERFLKNIGPNPILLVLDDVWPDSESLLEKFRFQIADLKILVTSRFAFPRFSSTYKLQPLNDKDSSTLFCNSAFPPNQSPEVPDETISKIVKGSTGFPLALEVVGRSLCGQPAEIWETRALELSKVTAWECARTSARPAAWKPDPMSTASKNIVAELNKGEKLNMKMQYVPKELVTLQPLNATMDEPEDGPTIQHRRNHEIYDARKRENYLAGITLRSNMDGYIMREFKKCDSAMDFGVALKAKFGSTSISRLRSLAIKFDSYKKCPEHTMKKHLRQMSNMISELEDAGYKLTDEQQIQAVIRSLPQSWQHMKMDLTYNEHIKTFEDVSKHLELEEERLEATKPSVEVYLASSSSNEGSKHKSWGKGRKPSQPNKKANNDNQNQKKRGKKKNLSKVKCYNCDQMGHLARDCTKPKKAKEPWTT